MDTFLSDEGRGMSMREALQSPRRPGAPRDREERPGAVDESILEAEGLVSAAGLHRSDGGPLRRRLYLTGLLVGAFVALALLLPRWTRSQASRHELEIKGFHKWNFENLNEEKCQDATQTDFPACFKAIQWAMIHGINEHPMWYTDESGKVLTTSSPFTAFQAVLHRDGHGDCPPPCSGTTTPPPTTPKPEESPSAQASDKPHGSRWRYDPLNHEPLGLRTDPKLDAALTGNLMHEGDEFSPADEVRGEDGVIFLKIVDEDGALRGWAFDKKPGVGKMCVEIEAATAEEEDEEDEEQPHNKTHLCSGEGEDCSASKCCSSAGLQCYTKNPYWSECMETCTPGPHPSDPDNSPWTCKPQGERTPGLAKICAEAGATCTEVKCCKDVGMQCYTKNSTYATCKSECSAGPDLTDSDWAPWECNELGPRKPGPANWVAEKCSVDGADCSHTGCCLSAGKACFEKQKNAWATCKRTCTPGVDPDTPWDTQEWTCKQLGGFTPVPPPVGAKAHGMVAKWVETRCAGEQDDCTESRCCKSVNHACYRKNEYWSQCQETCPTEIDPKTNKSMWDCSVLGPRSWGLATKGFPAIFCLSVMRVTGYEPDLMRAQLSRGFGIFACDGFLVIANGNISLGYLPGSKEFGMIRTVSIPSIPVGRSQDGTAANTLLFMTVWDAVLRDGRYRNYDWTIKADPDAVVMADRLRLHVAPHNGENVYFVNCNAYPDSPNFPMMYGSLEVFSRLAMLAYSKGSGRCGSELPWKLWGEDYFMTHCLDYLGVGRVGDFMIIGDNVCTGANCADGWVAAFHPFKTVDSWTQCLNSALAAPKPSPWH